MRNGNTDYIAILNFQQMQFLSYLWGMETLLSLIFARVGFPFLSYLWGMETIIFKHVNLPPYDCSYPTYEEWKLRYKSYRYIKHCRVLILPMRNGNHIFCHLAIMRHQFLSYLWGMETLNNSFISKYVFCSYPTYEEWKHWPDEKIRNSRYIRFLSYLWGMETIHRW